MLQPNSVAECCSETSSTDQAPQYADVSFPLSHFSLVCKDMTICELCLMPQDVVSTGDLYIILHRRSLPL